jgi:hypothetical protein
MENTDFTQHHHWGTVDHGLRQQVYQQHLADEYLWEFMTPEDLLESLYSLETQHNWIVQGGGFLLTDEPKPIARFHLITVWAYHPDPKRLTWISLQTKITKLS